MPSSSYTDTMRSSVKGLNPSLKRALVLHNIYRKRSKLIHQIDKPTTGITVSFNEELALALVTKLRKKR